MDHRGGRSDEARPSATSSSGGCAIALRPAACCTMVRENGIPVNRCRAGRSRCIGAATGCRCGTMPSGRPRNGRRQSHHRRCRRARARHRPAHRSRSGLRRAGVRRCAHAGHQRSRTAGKRHDVRFQTRRSRRTRPARARVPARTEHARRLRAAGAALERGRSAALALGAVVDAGRTHATRARRLAGGLPSAARRRCRVSSPKSGRSFRRPIRSRRCRPYPNPKIRSRRRSGASGPARKSSSGSASNSSSKASRSTVRCAPQFPSNRATGACASSCRRPNRPPTISNCSAPSRSAAAGLATPVHIEGYPPPYDPRINVIKVTPDPGVIEVNIHPARSWREAVAITTTLYEEARLARLATEKFQTRRQAHRNRRRQSHRRRRSDAGRQPVLAPARSAAEPRRLLAEPSFALVSVLGPVHRPDESSAARR